MRFLDPQYDQTEHGQEIEAVSRHAVEGDERLEGAGEDIQGREQRIEDHGRDGREENIIDQKLRRDP